ncbi:hypothetical protein J6590_061900, partial [Homalodisca vitripennis]
MYEVVIAYLEKSTLQQPNRFAIWDEKDRRSRKRALPNSEQIIKNNHMPLVGRETKRQDF